MILKQYYLGCLAHASYLLGDEATSTAIIVDPQRDIHQYLVDAGKFGLEIRHVFLTHFHADFVAGHLELRDRCGATIRLGARAKAEYAFVSMKDGDTLEFTGLRDKFSKHRDTPSNRSRSWCSIWRRTRQNLKGSK
jgi:glyoxylase-like metal-dependent hydrolase (beta-lactamase superfamily II)